MTEFEKILQECLRDLEQGASTVDECLVRHPRHAQQLEPVLLASTYLQRGRETRPSAAFKARVRTRLVQQMYTRPRRPARSNFMFIHSATLPVRLAAGLAAVLLALLVTGTGYAQSALPGDAFYTWKLASENAWRTVSSDPVKTDLMLAERRVDELIAVGDDPRRSPQALKEYDVVTTRLKSELDAENQARILGVLDAQVEELDQAGVLPVRPGQDVTPQPQPVTPASTPTAAPPTSTLPISAPPVTVKPPHVDPTKLPKILPTVRAVPTKIVPPIKVPPKIVPTIKIPPRIP